MLARWDCVILGCNSTPVMILKIMRTKKSVFLRRSKTHNQKVLPRVKTECETVTWDLALFFFASLLLWLARESNVCLTCHVISQSAFTRRESNFGAKISFEIKNTDWNQQLMDGGILANWNSTKLIIPIVSWVQILAFLHVICERVVSCPPPENRLQR